MKLKPDSVSDDPPLQRAEHANLKFLMPCRKTESTSRSQDRASEGRSPIVWVAVNGILAKWFDHRN